MKPIILSVILINLLVLSAVMLNVVMPSVVAPFIITALLHISSNVQRGLVGCPNWRHDPTGTCPIKLFKAVMKATVL